MKICVPCKQEMKCEQNGVVAHWGRGHVQQGDTYYCRKCGTVVLVCNPITYHQEDLTGEHVVDMAARP